MSGTAWPLPGQTLFVGSDGQTTLELLSGGSFDLTGATEIATIQVVDDQALGNSTITLQDGVDLTVRLGSDFATVIGADNADTIDGGYGGYDTVVLGSGRESFQAGPEGATIRADAAFLTATIDGANRSELDVTGSGTAVTLGANISGIADLDILGGGLTLDTGVVDIPFIALSNSMDTVVLRSAHQEIEDEIGGNTIAFASTNQTLYLPYANLLSGNPGNPYGGAPAGTLTGFGEGDTIEINLPYSSSETLSFDPASGELVLAAGGYSQTIDLQGQYSGSFAFQQGAPQVSGYCGTDVTFSAEEAPCFAAGTRLLTPSGEAPVESLRVGDVVVTAAGAEAPIVWAGQRRIDFRRLPADRRIMPVRVRAGAFGPAVPSRDLVLSPDHAIHADGVLIPVGKLVNGASIVRERVQAVHYFHVELPRHAVLLAEGLEVESYLDTGNRAGFADGVASTELRSTAAPRGWERACAPLVLDGPRLAKVRRRVLARCRLLRRPISSGAPPRPMRAGLGAGASP